MKCENFLIATIIAALLGADISATADILIPINVRPFACDKNISRFETKDIPVAIYNGVDGLPGGPQFIESVTIEGWIQPTKLKIFKAKNVKGQNKWCTVKAPFNDKEVYVYYFPAWAVLREYDYQPYTNYRVLSVLRLTIKHKEFDEPFVGFASINIVK